MGPLLSQPLRSPRLRAKQKRKGVSDAYAGRLLQPVPRTTPPGPASYQKSGFPPHAFHFGKRPRRWASRLEEVTLVGEVRGGTGQGRRRRRSLGNAPTWTMEHGAWSRGATTSGIFLERYRIRKYERRGVVREDGKRVCLCEAKGDGLVEVCLLVSIFASSHASPIRSLTTCLPFPLFRPPGLGPQQSWNIHTAWGARRGISSLAGAVWGPPPRYPRHLRAINGLLRSTSVAWANGSPRVGGNRTPGEARQGVRG